MFWLVTHSPSHFCTLKCAWNKCFAVITSRWRQKWYKAVVMHYYYNLIFMSEQVLTWISVLMFNNNNMATHRFGWVYFYASGRFQGAGSQFDVECECECVWGYFFCSLTCWCSLEMMNLTISCNFLRFWLWRESNTCCISIVVKAESSSHRNILAVSLNKKWSRVANCVCLNLENPPKNMLLFFTVTELQGNPTQVESPYMLLLWFKTTCYC